MFNKSTQLFRSKLQEPPFNLLLTSYSRSYLSENPVYSSNYTSNLTIPQFQNYYPIASPQTVIWTSAKASLWIFLLLLETDPNPATLYQPSFQIFPDLSILVSLCNNLNTSQVSRMHPHHLFHKDKQRTLLRITFL